MNLTWAVEAELSDLSDLKSKKRAETDLADRTLELCRRCCAMRDCTQAYYPACTQ